MSTNKENRAFDLSTEFDGMTEKEVLASNVIAMTKEEKESIQNLIDLGQWQVKANAIIGARGGVKDIVLHLGNYRDIAFNTALDELRYSMRLNRENNSGLFDSGIIQAPVVHKIKDTFEDGLDHYFLSAGNHRFACFFLDCPNAVFPIAVTDTPISLDKGSIAREHLTQMHTNKHIPTKFQDELRAIVNAFKAKVSFQEIESLTGLNRAKIQSLLKISGDCAKCLAELGFDLDTNPFNQTQMKKLPTLFEYFEHVDYNKIAEEEGKKNAPSVFIKALEDKAKEIKEAEKVEETVVSEGNKAVAVTEKTVEEGKIVEKVLIVEVPENQVVTTIKDPEGLRQTLMALSEEYIELLDVIGKYFTVQ